MAYSNNSDKLHSLFEYKSVYIDMFGRFKGFVEVFSGVLGAELSGGCGLKRFSEELYWLTDSQ